MAQFFWWVLYIYRPQFGPETIIPPSETISHLLYWAGVNSSHAFPFSPHSPPPTYILLFHFPFPTIFPLSSFFFHVYLFPTFHILSPKYHRQIPPSMSGGGGRGMLYTSTAPLPMTTMGYTSMRYTSMALYFYEENTQALNKFFYKHCKQKICK